MRYATLSLAVTGLLFVCSTAHAKPRTTFPSEQNFQSCTETTAFACGKISADGQRYGTAHTRTMCSTYKLLADGSAMLGGYPGSWETGRYRIRGAYVHIEVLDKQGKVTYEEKLLLSKDGKELGEMKRLDLEKRP